MFNIAKTEILAAIRDFGELTSMDISMTTQRTPECASMNLLKYYRQGLLARRTIHGKAKGYRLTARGYERLIWLLENYGDE